VSGALTINARCEYDRDTADHVLEQVSLGKTVSEACRDIGVNKGTFFGWVRKNVDGITERYDVARDLCLECRADELVQLADDASADPQRSKLMLHARMWELARLKPQKYGDRNKIEHSGAVDMGSVSNAELESRIALLVGKAGVGASAGGAPPADDQDELA
jgi:hypothetical protein